MKTTEYGKRKFMMVDDLKIPEYYNKSIIEGKQSELFQQVVLECGIKSPLIVNCYKGREGVIVDGVQRYKIAKELNIIDVPVHFIDCDLKQEQTYFYALSVNKSEIPIEQIIEQLQRSYTNYFADLMPDLEQEQEINVAYDEGVKALEESKEVREVPHSFMLRLPEKYKEYPEKLKAILGASSQNQAIVQLIIATVESEVESD